MSLFRGSYGPTEQIWQGLPTRSPRRQGSVDVTKDSAFSHSAVWAAIRLRAEMISNLPIDCFREYGGGLKMKMTVPRVLQVPSTHGPGQPLTIREWLYSTQVDLDRLGNCFGLISAHDGAGRPAQIDLLAGDTVTVCTKKGIIDHYKVGQKEYGPEEIWHERQHTVAGIHVGLSPIAYAAQSIGAYLSAQQFALDWFGNGAFPGSILKNTAKTLRPDEAAAVKRKFMTTVQSGEPFVTGLDWDYKMIQATAAESAFLESMQYSISDIARFFNVPADLLDATTTSKAGKILYANITQFNLQFLILHLQAAYNRREDALSTLLSGPQTVKFRTSELLRMDPAGQAGMDAVQITSRVRAPSEIRASYNLPPFTDAQIQEFADLGITSAPAAPTEDNAPTPAGGNDNADQNQN